MSSMRAQRQSVKMCQEPWVKTLTDADVPDIVNFHDPAVHTWYYAAFYDREEGPTVVDYGQHAQSLISDLLHTFPVLDETDSDIGIWRDEGHAGPRLVALLHRDEMGRTRCRWL